MGPVCWSGPIGWRSPAPGLPRLLPDPPVTSLVAHRAHWGPMPGGDLVGETCRSGLRGRGGAGFPTGLKMKAVQRAASGTGWRRRRPIVVANGTEGEPASAKDRALLVHSPHLVLDGLAAAAASLGAQRAILCVKHDQRPVLAALERALAERRGQDEIELELSTVPSGYVSGEESALVNWLTAGVPRPTITPPRPSERGVCSRPTLVDNVETMANLGVIARLGADWWRGLGTEDDPGSILLTISGAVARPGVYEVANGSRLQDAARPRRTGQVTRCARRRLLRHLAHTCAGSWCAAQPGVSRCSRRLARVRSRRCAARPRLPVGGVCAGRPMAGRRVGRTMRALRERASCDRRGDRGSGARNRRRTSRATGPPLGRHGRGARRLQAARRRGQIRAERASRLLDPRRAAPVARRPVPAVRFSAVAAVSGPGIGPAMGMRMTLNPIRCDGRGLCAVLLPELISLDDWGYPVLRQGDVPAHLEADARRAASACPVLALSLRRSAAGES